METISPSPWAHAKTTYLLSTFPPAMYYGFLLHFCVVDAYTVHVYVHSHIDAWTLCTQSTRVHSHFYFHTARK